MAACPCCPVADTLRVSAPHLRHSPKSRRRTAFLFIAYFRVSTDKQGKSGLGGVERLYRHGETSICEIARREGVSEVAIRKRAKAQGWERESGGRYAARGTHRSRRALAFRYAW
jgi:hypothetical protein